LFYIETLTLHTQLSTPLAPLAPLADAKEYKIGKVTGTASQASDASDASEAGETGEACEVQAAPQTQTRRAAAAIRPEPVAGSSSSSSSSSSKYTREQVAAHNTKDDCWIILHNRVYDITDFLADHPGGRKAPLLYAGKDATEEFDLLHKPAIITKYGRSFLKGTIVAGAAAKL
jgi:cytochrome b involved in lipid metabolism